MNRIRFILFFIVIVVVAATSSWLLKTVELQPFSIVEPPRHDMDYFLTNFNATIMNKNGTPHYILKGTRLEHFPDDSSVDITLPTIDLFRDNLSPWQAKSEKARILKKGKLIFLNGKVSMQRSQSEREPEIKLETSNLTINTELDFAETRDAVHIQTEKHHLKATGMRVYLADDRLELLSDVDGFYNVTN